MDRKNAWTDLYSKEELDRLEHGRMTEYKNCLDAGKTERECVATGSSNRQRKKDIRISEISIKNGEEVKAGDKTVCSMHEQDNCAVPYGYRNRWTEGMNILGAHIDSPRIDVKQNPLYENEEFAYLDTHYYGGIKKYQWVTIPLALHGVVAKKERHNSCRVCIGEKEDDPVFVVSRIC